MLPCVLKIKCTNEVIDDLDFSDLDARLILVRRINLGDINFLHKLPESRGVKLLHISVLPDRCNKLSDIDFLLFLFLDFLPKIFDKVCKVSLFQFIVTGQYISMAAGVGLAVVKLLTDKLGGNVFAKIENDTLTISLEIK